jgi:hypothetical protein
VRLLPVAGDDFEPLEVVVMEVAELSEFFDRVRALVDAQERRMMDAISFMPHERRDLPPVVPLEYFE